MFCLLPLEVLGYAGCITLSGTPSPILINLSCREHSPKFELSSNPCRDLVYLTIGPAFLTASIYLYLGRNRLRLRSKCLTLHPKVIYLHIHGV
jgi:hypothetical protein